MPSCLTVTGSRRQSSRRVGCTVWTSVKPEFGRQVVVNRQPSVEQSVAVVDQGAFENNDSGRRVGRVAMKLRQGGVALFLANGEACAS